jgi:hypothetical protein
MQESKFKCFSPRQPVEGFPEKKLL